MTLATTEPTPPIALRDPAWMEADALEQCVREAQAGATDAMGALVDAFGPRVLGYLREFLGHPQDAEDIAQETFVRALRALPSLRAPRTFPAWLFTIARRTALNHRRSARDTSPLDSEEPCSGPDPAAATRLRDECAALWDLARQLPHRQREALWLHYAEDLTIAEIARITGRSAIAIRVQLHRGRQQLIRLHRRSDATRPVRFPTPP